MAVKEISGTKTTKISYFNREVYVILWSYSTENDHLKNFMKNKEKSTEKHSLDDIKAQWDYTSYKDRIESFIKNKEKDEDLDLLDYFINSKSKIARDRVNNKSYLNELLELDEKISMVDWDKFEKTNLFSRAALTRYNELKSLNIKEENILIKRIDSSYHLEFYWNTFLKKFKSIKLLEIFSHADDKNGYPDMNGWLSQIINSWPDLFPNYKKKSTQWFWDEEYGLFNTADTFFIGNNKLNFSKNAIIGFYGCKTSFGAKKYSKKFKEIITFGQGFGSVFSQKKNKQMDITDGYTGPVYLQDCASIFNGSPNWDYPGEIFIDGDKISYKKSLKDTGLYPK